jgi:ABC-type multidrug transport system ATPase subunit
MSEEKNKSSKIPFVISTQNLGKKFSKDWLYRNFSYQFNAGNSYAVLGRNGSGKSTLLLHLASFYGGGVGTISYTKLDVSINPERFYQHYALVSPLLELPEEQQVHEFLSHYFAIKPLANNLTVSAVLEAINLKAASGKNIKELSSGMKQRLKLAMAFYSDVPVLFLDEPCTNLDVVSINWYTETMEQIKHNKLIIVASNNPAEYTFCNERIEIEMFQSL